MAFTIQSQVRTRAGKIGLGFLIAAGVGSAMASVFDINHPLHNLAGMIGVLSSPVAAMLISVSLSRMLPWSAAKKILLWTANLTWVILALFALSMVVLIVTYIQAGGDMNVKSTEVKALPAGVIAFVGYPNRLMIIVNSVWAVTVAWLAIRFAKMTI